MNGKYWKNGIFKNIFIKRRIIIYKDRRFPRILTEVIGKENSAKCSVHKVFTSSISLTNFPLIYFCQFYLTFLFLFSSFINTIGTNINCDKSKVECYTSHLWNILEGPSKIENSRFLFPVTIRQKWKQKLWSNWPNIDWKPSFYLREKSSLLVDWKFSQSRSRSPTPVHSPVWSGEQS